ncbi:DNA polymerase X family/PHP domain protein [Nautilia profundicola AmH]|uniref:DNA polymerase beta n=1 Tax=Nautilia profundicola (strain ATCC BAA-1463 / DSM 18972 / AmH) TaxID=598659 RepID=B9L654_NAUPA|nr:helix-hairpin-helix domain-containing protein [Nautilia profundicola]ACM93069.1 DNA polymerase X family/PHP domain protein [Nautilia profundicola AmH]
MVTNKQIADILSKTADLMEIKGENPFKVRAYRNAARILENSAKDFSKLVKEGFDLTKLPGIGHDLSEYIKEIVNTGKFHKLEELQKEIPKGVVELLSIEGLGPKRVKQLYETFGIKNMDDLKKYAYSGELDKLPGFGPKLIEKILKGVKQLKKAGIRFLWAEVEDTANELKDYLLEFEGVETVDIAGSFRRKKESVGDLDILVIAKDYPKVSEYFIKFHKVKEVYSKGLTRSTVFLDNDLQVDLRAVAKESYGAALHYFTGSKSHNIEIRKLAIQKGLKINEYGVYKGNERIASLTEEDVYKSVGLEYVEPELRENRGEIEAAMSNSLPKLIKADDIRGVMENVITKEEVDKAVLNAKKNQFEYLILNVDKDCFLEINEYIANKNRDIKIIRCLTVRVDENGEIEAKEDLLEKADFVCAIMKEAELNSDMQTKRYIKALQNPYVKVLLRPSLREVLKKEGVDLDWDEVFECANKHHKAMEINSNPKYLDLSDVLIKKAIDKNVKLLLNSYHNSFKYGLNQARRGWCEKEDLLNTFSYERIKKFFNF